jgi:CRP-like cAMP-binding protein
MSARTGGTQPTFDKHAILRRHPMFGQLGADAINRLASYSATRPARAGATIFRKGDPGASLFAVCKGTVRISNQSADGKDAVFNLINAGEIFGEIALLDGQPRTADALAVSDCELMVIDRRDFIPLISQNPQIAIKLIELLCGRIRHTSEQVEDVTFLDLAGRLAKALLRLSKNAAASGASRIRITQREIGEIIGTSRESTNKQLREWEEKKWIRLERGSVVVLAPDMLEEIAESGGLDDD